MITFLKEWKFDLTFKLCYNNIYTVKINLPCQTSYTMIYLTFDNLTTYT